MSDSPSSYKGNGKDKDEKPNNDKIEKDIPNSGSGSRTPVDPNHSSSDSRITIEGTSTTRRSTQQAGPPPPSSSLRKPIRLRGHQSLELTTSSLDDDNNKILPGQGGSSKSKGKSASEDAMGKRLKKLSKDKLYREEQDVSLNNSFSIPPYKKVSQMLSKGRIFRSNKVAPAHLEEVITVSPVMICPSILSDCDHLRNNLHDHGHMGEASTLHNNDSDESMDNICRICHDSPASEKLITPCLCKGSMGQVHRSCLERWLGESGKNVCEICGQEYNTVRVPKYKGFRSFFAWIRNPLTPSDTRNFFFDLACFFILTPLACLSAWLCVLGAQHYAFEEHKAGLKSTFNNTREARANRDASNSTWTSVGLLSLTGTLVAAYYIWIFVAVRYHMQVWREWQQRNFIVTIVPLANGEFSHSPAPPPPEREEPPGDNNEDEEIDPDCDTPVQRQGSSPFSRHAASSSDRNANSDNNNQSDHPPVCIRSNLNLLDHRNLTTQILMESLLQQNPNLTISDTTLFYQAIFGGESDEALSEEAMIRLATLRSEMDQERNKVQIESDPSVCPVLGKSCETLSDTKDSTSLQIQNGVIKDVNAKCERCLLWEAKQAVLAQEEAKAKEIDAAITDSFKEESSTNSNANENEENISKEETTTKVLPLDLEINRCSHEDLVKVSVSKNEENTEANC